ncbi:aspartate/glutamate racemase family protein [Aliagarivorans marinus]|uniref:aspartate/glutamate racemase family protein n=1 Tax=Aliagarivorans marinus TaxID=561965 RepID=UPI000425CB15|nr:aspartate/glutamate racemase family protein [Aliagarivorans marinus]
MSKITLIHAVDIAIAPVRRAFAQHWPEAQVTHLWDEALGLERAKSPQLTPALRDRVAVLYQLALSGGADAVMYTCSAFGEAIEGLAADASLPVLKPNQAMFDEAIALGQPVAMLGSFQPAMEGMEREFLNAAEGCGKCLALRSVCVPEARTALQAGDLDVHNQLMLDALQQVKEPVVMLAHFSSAPAKDLLELRSDKTVLSSPDCAVRYLQHILRSE